MPRLSLALRPRGHLQEIRVDVDARHPMPQLRHVLAAEPPAAADFENVARLLRVDLVDELRVRAHVPVQIARTPVRVGQAGRERGFLVDNREFGGSTRVRAPPDEQVELVLQLEIGLRHRVQVGGTGGQPIREDEAHRVPVGLRGLAARRPGAVGRDHKVPQRARVGHVDQTVHLPHRPRLPPQAT